jgi:methylthioribose-1-phosphate isomerase
VLTHCNAGALATSGRGTALAVIFAAREAGRTFRVYADETRPLLQGARLTAWELLKAGMEPIVLCDNAAGRAMAEGRVDLVVVGADRIAANGDVANKIGTYSLAVLARHHGVPFYVAAPSSTFDLELPDGSAIPIEERSAEEVLSFHGARSAPAGAAAYNPAFDVTPAGLITALITEHGLIEEPDEGKVRRQLGSGTGGA